MLYLRRVVGDSMMPNIAPGRLVLFVRQKKYHTGDVVLALVHGREVIKRIMRSDAGRYWLEGDNSPHSTDSRQYGYVNHEAIRAKKLL